MSLNCFWQALWTDLIKWIITTISRLGIEFQIKYLTMHNERLMTSNENTSGTSSNVYLRFPVHPRMFLHTPRIQNLVADFLQSSGEEIFVFPVLIDVLIFFLPANEC